MNVLKQRKHFYRLKLSVEEISALCWIGDMYGWSMYLYANISEGEVILKEHEMWEWVDEVNSEGGLVLFHLASPEFADKLQKFYDSCV